MTKKHRKHKRRGTSADANRHGFEFGYLPRVMYANTSGFDLNNHMINGRVVGCAYGVDRVKGYPDAVPCLTFVGEVASELLEASKCLELWGCGRDGDSVDIEIILKTGGGYFLVMQPNYKRLMHRVVKDVALINITLFSSTWIKTMDTTHPIIFKWKEHLTSKISPVKIGFATAKVVGGVPQFDTIEPLEGALSFVKFGLKIQSEEECPDHWALNIVRRTKREGSQPGPVKGTPNDVAAARTNVINSAFPISRTRLRRTSITDQVMALASAPIARNQIEQATINVLLSREWTGGQDHYAGVANLESEWWERVGHRVEIAGTPNTISEINPATVYQQLTLDVAHTLRRHGASVSPKFQANQRLFARLGYAQA